MVLVLTALLVCLTALGLALLLRPRPQPAVAPDVVPSVLDERLLDYVVVTLKSGTTFGGVLYVEDAGAVVLAKAENIKADGTKVTADGEIIVCRGDIDFIQRP